MAKAYLSAKSPDLLTRTWADVMEHYSVTGVESTRKRKATAFRSRPFALLRGITLMDTEAGHLLAVLQHERAGNSAHHYLRRLHNYALHLGWLLMPVMAEAAWPEVRKKKFTAITRGGASPDRGKRADAGAKLYYEMLGETGGSQSDIACFALGTKLISQTRRSALVRRKLAGKESGGESLLRIGACIRKLLNQLPHEWLSLPKD